MIRKLLGILIVMLIAIAGVAWVELGSRGAGKQATADTRSTTSYRIVLGGDDAGAETSIPMATSEPPPRARIDADAEEHPQTQLTGLEEAGRRPQVRIPPVAPREFHYSVREGDSLASIAREYLGSDRRDIVDRIAKDNAIRNPSELKIGQPLVIRVERCDTFTATGKESWRDLARRFYGVADRVAPLIRANESIHADTAGRIPKDSLVWIPR